MASKTNEIIQSKSKCNISTSFCKTVKGLSPRPATRYQNKIILPRPHGNKQVARRVITRKPSVQTNLTIQSLGPTSAGVSRWEVEFRKKNHFSPYNWLWVVKAPSLSSERSDVELNIRLTRKSVIFVRLKILL